MGILNKKLDKNEEEKIKNYLLNGGFTINNKSENELYYLYEGVELSAFITVNIQSKTFHSYIESNFGLGRAASVSVPFDFVTFEETYTKFFDTICSLIR